MRFFIMMLTTFLARVKPVSQGEAGLHEEDKEGGHAGQTCPDSSVIARCVDECWVSMCGALFRHGVGQCENVSVPTLECALRAPNGQKSKIYRAILVPGREHPHP
jgi:hypothetical protein